MNIGFISLGCAKNQVDSEEILSYLKRNGFEIVSDPELSDIIIVNTCAFIEQAKVEAIRTILDMTTYKKPLIVIGCMAQRYYEELKQEIPEIDLIIPIEDYSKLTRKERDIHQYITISLITDRGVTHELVRHRIASYSQESTRYCNYSKDKFSNQITVIKPVDLPEDGLEIWKQAMENAEKSYFDLLKVSSPQIARSVLPNSLKTEICVTASINEWKLIFELRCSSFAHPDIRYIMNKVKSYFIEKGYIDETI